MSGNITGGLKARDANLKNDPDFYRRIGKLGGSKTGVLKGFALMKANGQDKKIREAGRRGGKIGRRGPRE